MTTTAPPLAVLLDPALDVPFTHGTLAGLPQWLRRTETGPADVVAVTADTPDWPDRLRAVLTDDAPPRAVLLSRVTPANPATVSELAALADKLGIPVVVDSPWALDPTATEHAERLRAAAAGAVVVDTVVVVPTAAGRAPAAVLLDQLALVRLVVGPVSGLRVTGLDGRGHTAGAHAGGVPVQLSSVLSPLGSTQARLSIRSRGEQWQLRFADPNTARPTAALLIDDAGEQLQPTRYETAHRAAWRQLHGAATASTQPSYTLPDLVADLRLLPPEALR
ncbi:hypothetical protein OG824_34850 [Streptomyces prunicolor]|uniref:hypothetical protein n=1 Tax=Streptomyces prunicolor TaxID=67348 RepID=UPI00225133A1|nr:hypothetical protein [Streptomyces prunicolor]MCX5240402.1 hypothetical protein [Streptomyces prunicolor]